MKGKAPYLLIAILGVALDLGTKEVAFANLGPHARVEAIANDWFELAWHRVENRGGMFGVGQDYGEVLRYFRLAALGIVLYFFLRAPARLRLFMVALSLILAGALGNLYDSFFNGGAVRDFIQTKLKFMPQSWFGKLFDPWPTFNIADALILVGALCLIVQLVFDRSSRPETAAVPERGDREGYGEHDGLGAGGRA